MSPLVIVVRAMEPAALGAPHGPAVLLVGGKAFQTPFFLPDGTPNMAKQRQNNSGIERPKRLSLPLDAGRSLLGVDSPAEKRLSWRDQRVSPWRRATSIGPENPRAQPIPVALLFGPPER